MCKIDNENKRLLKSLLKELIRSENQILTNYQKIPINTIQQHFSIIESASNILDKLSIVDELDKTMHQVAFNDWLTFEDFNPEEGVVRYKLHINEDLKYTGDINSLSELLCNLCDHLYEFDSVKFNRLVGYSFDSDEKNTLQYFYFVDLGKNLTYKIRNSCVYLELPREDYERKKLISNLLNYFKLENDQLMIRTKKGVGEFV